MGRLFVQGSNTLCCKAFFWSSYSTTAVPSPCAGCHSLCPACDRLAGAAICALSVAGLGPPLVSRCLRGRGSRLGLGLACLGQGVRSGELPGAVCSRGGPDCAGDRRPAVAAVGGAARRRVRTLRRRASSGLGNNGLQTALRHAPKAIAARTQSDTRRHTRQAHAVTFTTTGSRNVW